MESLCIMYRFHVLNQIFFLSIILTTIRTFEMLAYTNVISTVPEIWQLVDTKYIILRYFRSNLRSDYFQKLKSTISTTVHDSLASIHLQIEAA